MSAIESGRGTVQPLFRCGAAARWLPRVLGAAVLAAAAWVLLSLDHRAPLAGTVKGLLILAAAAAALWVVRGGGELGVSISLAGDRVRFGRGSRSIEVTRTDLEALDYDAAFSSPRFWPPAVVLVDRHGRRWRIPAMIDDAGRLLDALIGDRRDLRSWAEARRLERRMARSRIGIPCGYVAALSLLVGAASLVRG